MFENNDGYLHRLAVGIHAHARSCARASVGRTRSTFPADGHFLGYVLMITSCPNTVIIRNNTRDRPTDGSAVAAAVDGSNALSPPGQSVSKSQTVLLSPPLFFRFPSVFPLNILIFFPSSLRRLATRFFFFLPRDIQSFFFKFHAFSIDFHVFLIHRQTPRCASACTNNRVKTTYGTEKISSVIIFQVLGTYWFVEFLHRRLRC